MNTGGNANALEAMLRLLKLEQSEENIFSSRFTDLAYGGVCGGEIIAQALSAAYQTVSGEKAAHSLHTYFVKPGNSTDPVQYRVERVNEGKSFSLRQVRATQNNREICSLSVSFHVEESGFQHQAPPPDVPGPEGLESDLERYRRIADQLPQQWREHMLLEKPIEIRQVDPDDPFAAPKKDPVKYNWVKTIGRMPDNPIAHRCLLAYASDFYLGGVAQQPHGVNWTRGMQVASIDYAIWFHRDFRVDDWLLFAMNSPVASGCRGMNFGKFFTKEGTLVASVVQECLMRLNGSGNKTL
jgi:acyl-CoA thioesterase II